MKRLILAILSLGSLASTASLAADEYGFAGCGAGTRIWGPRSMQTSASTTNHGTIPIVNNVPIGLPTSQPWSITFDLAGCRESAQPIAYFDQYDYMFANFSSIARDASKGSGDSLGGLAASFGCPQSAYGDFNKFMKKEFAGLFSQPGVKAVFEETRSRMLRNAVLMRKCTRLEGQADLEIASGH